MKYLCKDCGKELSQEESITYIAMERDNMIVDYASILCKKCSGKRSKKNMPEK